METTADLEVHVYTVYMTIITELYQFLSLLLREYLNSWQWTMSELRNMTTKYGWIISLDIIGYYPSTNNICVHHAPPHHIQNCHIHDIVIDNSMCHVVIDK